MSAARVPASFFQSSGWAAPKPAARIARPDPPSPKLTAVERAERQGFYDGQRTTRNHFPELADRFGGLAVDAKTGRPRLTTAHPELWLAWYAGWKRGRALAEKEAIARVRASGWTWPHSEKGSAITEAERSPVARDCNGAANSLSSGSPPPRRDPASEATRRTSAAEVA